MLLPLVIALAAGTALSSESVKAAGCALEGSVEACDAERIRRVPPQVDFHLGQLGETGWRAGGSLGYPLLDLGAALKTESHFPLYARGGMSLKETLSRYTLGLDLMSPWIWNVFRGSAGGGMEIVNQSSGMAVQPYARLGTQVWILFQDFDLSNRGLLYSAGLRFEF